jgi:membrane associated rhomboid family serine protease
MRWSLILAALCVFVFVLQFVFPWLTDAFALVSSRFLLAPWTALTYIFLHGSVEHLLYNMFALVLFGIILETIIGERRFLLLFFAAGLVAALGSLLFYPSSIGASGAIFGVLGCLVVLRPRMTVWLGGVPMPMIFALFVWIGIDLAGVLFPSNVANAAHLFGVALGVAYGLTLRKDFGEKAPARKERSPFSDDEFRLWERKYMR